MTDTRVLKLYPYLLRSTWVFDDERTHLKEEAFVLGMTEMITRIVRHKKLPKAEEGFTLSFSDEPFDGHDVELQWIEEDVSGVGNWYEGTVAGEKMTGWLCPALQLYFDEAPPRIFIRAERLPRGVNPIWNPRGDIEPRRFVEAPR